MSIDFSDVMRTMDLVVTAMQKRLEGESPTPDMTDIEFIRNAHLLLGRDLERVKWFHGTLSKRLEVTENLAQDAAEALNFIDKRIRDGNPPTYVDILAGRFPSPAYLAHRLERAFWTFEPTESVADVPGAEHLTVDEFRKGASGGRFCDSAGTAHMANMESYDPRPVDCANVDEWDHAGVTHVLWRQRA